MRKLSKVWQGRLFAAVAALALVVACTIGAYAHAAGHALPLAEHAEAVAGTDDHAGHHHAPAMKAAASEPGHIGHTHDGDGTGPSQLDCLDIVCHGGQAVLAPDTPLLPVPHSVPAIGPVAAFDGAKPGGLDRPPKAFRPA